MLASLILHTLGNDQLKYSHFKITTYNSKTILKLLEQSKDMRNWMIVHVFSICTVKMMQKESRNIWF